MNYRNFVHIYMIECLWMGQASCSWLLANNVLSSLSVLRTFAEALGDELSKPLRAFGEQLGKDRRPVRGSIS